MFRTIIWIFFLHSVEVYSECSSGFRVNITDGIQMLEKITKNGVTFEKENYIREIDTFWGCFCEETCVQKCCANNNMIINNVCMESNTGSIEISDSNHSETHLSPDDLRCEYTDNISEEDLWEGISDGSVFVKKRGNILEFSELCLERSPNDHIFMCIFGKKSDRNKLSENNTAIIIGDGTKSDEVDICSRKICVRKCCALGEILWKNHTCFEKNYPLHSLESSLLEINFNKDIHHLFSSMLICGANFVRVSTPVFQLEINGSINSEGLSISTHGYCLDTFLNKNGKYDFMALICEMEDAEIEIVYNSSGMIISMPFLLATFLVYLFLPETNLHRRALMSYVLTLFLGYIILVSVQLTGDVIPTVPCHLLGYSILFFFTVSFFWMNVMCVDMWLAFRGMRGYGGRKGAERKRFFFYCIYAWGMPMLHTLVVFSINTYVDETSTLHPAIGTTRCFVGEGIANFLYFYLPAMILIIINITLFILTGIKIHRVKKETSMLKHMDSNRHSYEDDKQQFNLYVKLLFAMGINWTTEIMSWAIENFWKDTPKAVFYFTDFINATYGVFIFFIFVFKRKIWKSLKKSDNTLKTML